MKKRWRSRKCFDTMASRNVFNIFTVAGRREWFYKGLLGRKCILNVCTFLYFSEMRLFVGYFETPLPKITFLGVFLISNFRRILNVVSFLLGDSIHNYPTIKM
jgi:hypothetical protein